jgi:hypothetical protein
MFYLPMSGNPEGCPSSNDGNLLSILVARLVFWVAKAKFIDTQSRNAPVELSGTREGATKEVTS